MGDFQEMNGVFSEVRKCETLPLVEVFGLLGATIRKTAISDLSEDEARAAMQRAYLVGQEVRSFLEKSEEGEDVPISADLLAAVQKDAEGVDADPVPISEAMTIIGARLNAPEAAPAPEAPADEPVAKTDDVVWGPDLAADAVDSAPNWGPDPDWSAVE